MMGWDGNKGMPTASVVVEDANKYKLVETMLNEIQENRDRISEFCFYPVTYLEAYTLKKYYTSMVFLAIFMKNIKKSAHSAL